MIIRSYESNLSNYEKETYKKIFQASTRFEPMGSAILVPNDKTGRAGHFKWVHKCHSEVHNDYGICTRNLCDIDTVTNLL